MLHTKTFTKDKEGTIALLILIVLTIGYLLAMFLWIRYEQNRPIVNWRIHDVVGTGLLYKATRSLHNKLFKRDRG